MSTAPVNPMTPPEELRGDELQQLRTWLEAPHGTVAVVHGPRGVGKERVAGNLVQIASQRSDVAVLEARCPPAGARSFHPFAELARQGMAWAEQRGLSDAIVDPLYAELAPVMEHAVSEDLEREGPSLDQKLAFFESFRRLLGSIAHHARLCAVVHDLERADADTIELASYLADELFGDPSLETGPHRRGLLLLVTRDDDRVDPRISDFVEEMRDCRTAHTLGLQGLDLEGLRRYVQSPHVLQKLLAASSGLPQELDALIDALPTNVEELFERRLDNLDPAAREVLLALAVAGRPASARHLARVTHGSVKDVARALSTLRSERIVTRRIRSGDMQFNFTRRSDLEVALETLATSDRADLHGAWAHVLADEAEAGPALLAYHQLRSPEPKRGVPLAIQAAETHAVAGAIHAAIEILEDARPHAAGELKLAILSRLADLAPLTGNPRRALRYVEEWKAAAPVDARGRVLSREAELRNTAGDFQLALDVLAEAEAHLSPDRDPVERARSSATGAEACYNLSRLDEASARCEAGLALLERLEPEARRGRHERVRIELLNQLGKVALARGDAERAIGYFNATREAAEASSLQTEAARALVNIGIVQLRQGRLALAEEHLRIGIEKAREANELSWVAFGFMSIGALHHQSGALGKAIVDYRECKSIFRRLGNRGQLARVLNNLGNLYLACGDVEHARAYNDQSLRLASASGIERVTALATVVDGLLLGEEGRYEDAERRLREGMLLQQRQGEERATEALIELAELHQSSGALDRAAHALAEAESALERVESRHLEGRVAYLRGRLETEPEAAIEALERAREIFAEGNRRLYERDCELALARTLHAGGRTEMARMRLESARRIQDEVCEGLPAELRPIFVAARPQTESDRVEALLEGREQTSALPAPSTEPAARPVAITVPRQERKPQWRERYGDIIGESPKLLRVFHILDRVADSEGAVLVYGESGTGKELVAEAIHQSSRRSKGPFVKLNCAALVESLLMSELFGHERGSFTGAHQRKIGRFEMAAGGTLFLDEIGDISPKTQVALLRVLQEREFERVGGGKTLELDARIVFATNRNLAQMVKEGTFREDLYYRLKGITIDLPPLRDRPEDIRALAEHFLSSFAKESDSPKKALSPAAASLLEGYAWPGNIRELENIMRSVALFAEGDALTARDFDEYGELFRDAPRLQSGPTARPTVSVVPPVQARVPEPTPPAEVLADPAPPEPVPPAAEAKAEDDGAADLLGQIFDQGVPLPELKKQIQHRAIARALKLTEGNITRAAEILGMRRPRLSQIINADDELKPLTRGAS